MILRNLSDFDDSGQSRESIICPTLLFWQNSQYTFSSIYFSKNISVNLCT